MILRSLKLFYQYQYALITALILFLAYLPIRLLSKDRL